MRTKQVEEFHFHLEQALKLRDKIDVLISHLKGFERHDGVEGFALTKESLRSSMSEFTSVMIDLHVEYNDLCLMLNNTWLEEDDIKPKKLEGDFIPNRMLNLVLQYLGVKNKFDELFEIQESLKDAGREKKWYYWFFGRDIKSVRRSAYFLLNESFSEINKIRAWIIDQKKFIENAPSPALVESGQLRPIIETKDIPVINSHDIDGERKVVDRQIEKSTLRAT